MSRAGPASAFLCYSGRSRLSSPFCNSSALTPKWIPPFSILWEGKKALKEGSLLKTSATCQQRERDSGESSLLSRLGSCVVTFPHTPSYSSSSCTQPHQSTGHILSKMARSFQRTSVQQCFDSNCVKWPMLRSIREATHAQSPQGEQGPRGTKGGGCDRTEETL